MTSIIQEKAHQASAILQEKGIDAWLTFVRETPAAGDPVLPLIYGADLTWETAIIFTRSGERIIILGRYEAETARRIGAYTTVLPYDEAISPVLRETLAHLDPRQIAINYSKSDVLADGLSHGLYLLLRDYLAGTPYGDRLQPAEEIVAALRGRKTTSEVSRIRAAILTTGQIYEQVFDYVRPGMSEREISAFMHAELASRGLEPAWEHEICPIVNAGAESGVGHVGPTERKLAPGQVLHIDFGVLQDGYCADIQRVAYYLDKAETNPPEPVHRAFQTVVQAIQKAVSAVKPGVTGVEVDAIARRVIIEAGYPEYLHATGHQLGRKAHDGGGLLGPGWEKYGQLPFRPLEPGQVFTVELGVEVPDYGYISLEENILVTGVGAEFLSTPQTALIVR